MIGATMSGPFDTLAVARKLEAAGMDRRQAEALARAIRAGQGKLATSADLYRALWVQAAGIIVAIAALAGIVIGLASLWGGR